VAESTAGLVWGGLRKVPDSTLCLRSDGFRSEAVIWAVLGADLRDTSYGYPLFVDCSFENANLDAVDFGGSRFVRCRFSGRMFQVWFHGWYSNPHPSDEELFARTGTDPKTIKNPMDGVEFTDAILEDCMFVDGIDLSRGRRRSRSSLTSRGPSFDCRPQVDLEDDVHRARSRTTRTVNVRRATVDIRKAFAQGRRPLSEPR